MSLDEEHACRPQRPWILAYGFGMSPSLRHTTYCLDEASMPCFLLFATRVEYIT